MNGKELLQKAHRTIENVYKAGYADGCSDKQHDLEHDYAKGLEDAWECARSVINNEVPFEFWNLASGQSNLAVFKHYSAIGAIEKIKEYEEKQKEAAEIKVGDEVVDDIGTIAIVTRISGEEVYIVCGDGSAGISKKKDFKKTGRSFPEIEEALKQMKERE